jgi:hypothetical protein
VTLIAVVYKGGCVGLFKIDFQYLLITALVSIVATIAIVFFMNNVQPGLIVVNNGAILFIYIGVFSANLIIEAARKRLERNRKM